MAIEKKIKIPGDFFNFHAFILAPTTTTTTTSCEDEWPQKKCKKCSKKKCKKDKKCQKNCQKTCDRCDDRTLAFDY